MDGGKRYCKMVCKVKKAKRVVLRKVKEMLCARKQLQPAAGLRAKLQANMMKSMKIAQKAVKQRSGL